ncbi:uncharacterized protein LOC116433359 [Nomia melanderi]|uniref:uncharacterized protein LOC116433359 n=1 Tax=Nomia melanderi TaxID=2448451 RepID=UPI0013043050|nr:uncharacterized protein LOC116433359 [Nomia melanderi]
MGSPISPAIANIFMKHLEKRILKEAPLKPSEWFRYVDDTFVVWPNDHDTLPSFLEFVNNIHPNIKFTMEIESNKSLPFLDVLVTRKPDGSLGHQVYRKPTHTDRYLNASTHHHPAHKDSVIRSLVNCALKICDTNNLQAELDHVKHALIRNGFSGSRVQRTINKLHHSTPPAHDQTDEPNNSIAKCLKREGIKTIFQTETKIGQVLTSPKDQQLRLSHAGIYRIPCSCGKVYIGETGRSVSTCLIENDRCTRLKYTQSAVARHQHQLTTGHTIKFEETKILSRGKNYVPRKYRESIEILKHPNNINRDTGYQLNPIWHSLLPFFFLIVQLTN